ncbi:MAG: hypothetical protein R3F30_03040 [Planctomycetota bacterium]
MRSPALSSLTALAMSAALAAAQVPAGGSIETVVLGPSGANTGSEIWVTNPATSKSTNLTAPAAMTADLVNCVTMQNLIKGFVGTIGNKDAQGNLTPGSVWSITVTATGVTGTQLNTKPLSGQNVAQITQIGTDVYVCTNTISGTTSSVGTIEKIPVAGGAPSLVVDLATDSNWFSGQLVNSLCSDGVSKLYAGGWGTGQGIYEYDLTTTKSRVLCVLPNSKYSTGTLPFYACNLHISKLFKNAICAIGRYGDVAHVDMTTGKLLGHYHSNAGQAAQYYINAGDERADHMDVLVGSQQCLGVMIPFGHGGVAAVAYDNIGSDTVRTQNSVTGVWYNEGPGRYQAYGDGCAGTSYYTATSLDRGGHAVQGNGTWEMALESGPGGAVAVLMWGASNTQFANLPILPLDLTPAGAPGCNLRQDMLILIPVTLSGTGTNDGAASVKVPLPNQKATLYTQWLVLEKAANNLGMTFSDARALRL